MKNFNALSKSRLTSSSDHDLQVDAMPTQIQRRHIFFTNYTRDCWNGLQESAKQLELRRLKSKIWCTVQTAEMLKRYYPVLYMEVCS